LTAKKNIVQVVNGLGVGGGELKLLELLQRLNPEKYDITVISVGQGGILEQEFRRTGWPLIVLPRSWRFDPLLVCKLAREFRRVRADLVMSTLFYADILAAAASLIYRPKALVSWEVITGRLRPHQVMMYKLFSRRFDCVAAVSNSIHPFIIRDRGQDPRKIRTIYYGVDLAKFSFTARQKRSTPFVFGTVARLVHQKGHTHLLDAIPLVLKHHRNVEWHLVGDGDRAVELRDKARRLGIEQAVVFHGRQSDIPQFLSTFDCFVLPSLWEGFPNVVLEAMAAGLPVIATCVEGTDELVVHGETGFLVGKEDPQALATAMCDLLSTPAQLERFSIAGRKRVEKYFSVDKQIREFEMLYDELLMVEDDTVSARGEAK